ncbi:SHOCT domain-containing protein [Comamonas sp.]|uniref:SHOCT domain-containing protein n=1 Tax=Comamonas sp. TaxID=34028 RepID=UPI0028B141DF|nr:SHOCT domain-containing protein [Comamonas sp.]
MELFLLLVFWGLLSWGVASLATSRGRSGWGFFLLSFFMSPLLGLIIVLIMRDLAQENQQYSERQREEYYRTKEREREHEKQLESLRAISATQPKAFTAPSTNSPSNSIADELSKLATLRDQGVLTAEEFDQQKKTLLSSSTP